MQVSGKAIVVPSSSCLVNTVDAKYSRLTWCTMPVPGGTTRKLSNADCAHFSSLYLSWLRSNSKSMFCASAPATLK